MADRIATSAEVGAALRVSAATVQLHARRGRIPFDITPGGHRRYDIAEVQTALTGPVDDVETELGRRRAPGLGRGVDAPATANAAALCELRAARPEPRPVAVGATALTVARSSALEVLVSHARRVTLATVST